MENTFGEEDYVFQSSRLDLPGAFHYATNERWKLVRKIEPTQVVSDDIRLVRLGRPQAGIFRPQPAY